MHDPIEAISRATFRMLAAAAVLAASLPVAALAAEREAFRVCADPYNLPMSNRERQGYENKIAELFAGALNLPVQYTWFPQRIGFIRNTLRNNDTPDGSYKCDIVMGVPDNFELAATTKPYYRSVWVMVYAKGRGLDGVKTPADLAELPPEVKNRIHIGLFDRSPAAQWVLENDLMERAVPYQIMPGDARMYPGRVIEEDLVQGKIDVTFVWGPIGGYFAKRVAEPEMVVVPMPAGERIKFDYQIAMAVRFGENEWREQINALIDSHRAEINSILEEYGVPLLPLVERPAGSEDDD